MAEKNTESTAVNQLIELVATAKPLPPDPSEDLMFREVKPSRRAKKASASGRAPVSTAMTGMTATPATPAMTGMAATPAMPTTPAMTATVPPLKGASQVKPLPRTRAPVGTQQGLNTINRVDAPIARPLPSPNQALKAVPPGVRITTVPHSRTVTIPPLALDPRHDDGDDDEAEVTNPGMATFSRPTSQGLAPEGFMPPELAARPRATGSNAARMTAPGPAPSASPDTSDASEASDGSEESFTSRATKPTLPPPVPPTRASGAPPAPPFRPSSQPTTSFSYPIVPGAEVPAVARSAAAMPAVARSAASMPAAAMPAVARSAASMPAASMPVASMPVASMPAVARSAASMPAAAPAFETEHTDVDDPIASLLEPKSSLEVRLSTSWIENEIGTQQVAKRADWKTIAGRMIGPMLVLVIVGIFVGGYFAFDGDGGKQARPAPVEGQKISMPVTGGDDVATKRDEPAAPTANAALADGAAKVEAPAAAKLDEPAANASNLAATTTATTTPPNLVDIRIDSNPTGATVTLIDRGKSTFLGTTPMSAAVDASRKYELVFSYENRATVVEALDPSTQKRVSAKLARASSSASSVASTTPASTTPAVKADKPVAAKASAPNAVAKSGIDAALDSALEAPKAKPDVPKRDAPVADKAAAAAGGEGTLMISSKPPCDIVIDGKPTGLTTPQRAIALPAGAHKITFVNSAEGINKTVSVQITADQPTKVIQDFMK